MKILTTEQIRQADEFTIRNEPVASIDLMERASKAFVSKFLELQPEKKSVAVFCGTGNNGGDGLAIARLLFEKGWSVEIFTLGNTDKGSPDFKVNLQRIQDRLKIEQVHEDWGLPKLDNHIIIDAIFGSGLTRPATDLYGKIIEKINSTKAIIYSVDIASGLFANSFSNGAIIEPRHTITFQFPKLAFMQPNLAAYVGEWHVIDIGLQESYTESAPTKNYYTDNALASSLIPGRDKFMHKGKAGMLLLVSGSEGKMGASIFSARAALKSGLGLLVVHAPKCGLDIMQKSVPEAMVSVDPNEVELSDISIPDRTGAIAIGPGIGTSESTTRAVTALINYWKGPLVIDADGINILAKSNDLLKVLPKETILTPHPKEFERLVGTWNNDFEKLDLLRELCIKFKINVVLKGAHSAVCDSVGNIHFNSTGNPGMATAGSGDVLTGIIGALLAQELTSFQALRLGVYLHGLAGDLGVQKVGMHSLIASDIVNELPRAFLQTIRK